MVEDSVIVDEILKVTRRTLAEYAGLGADPQRIVDITMNSTLEVWCNFHGYILYIGECPESLSPYYAFMNRNGKTIRRKARRMADLALWRRHRKYDNIESAKDRLGAVIGQQYDVNYQSSRARISLPSDTQPTMVSFYIPYSELNDEKLEGNFRQICDTMKGIEIPGRIVRYSSTSKKSKLQWQN